MGRGLAFWTTAAWLLVAWLVSPAWAQGDDVPSKEMSQEGAVAEESLQRRRFRRAIDDLEARRTPAALRRLHALTRSGVQASGVSYNLALAHGRNEDLARAYLYALRDARVSGAWGASAALRDAIERRLQARRAALFEGPRFWLWLAAPPLFWSCVALLFLHALAVLGWGWRRGQSLRGQSLRGQSLRGQSLLGQASGLQEVSVEAKGSWGLMRAGDSQAPATGVARHGSPVRHDALGWLPTAMMWVGLLGSVVCVGFVLLRVGLLLPGDPALALTPVSMASGQVGSGAKSPGATSPGVGNPDASSLALRMRPDPDAPKSHALPSGTALWVMEEGARFVRVRSVDGKEGWMHRADLHWIDPRRATEQVAQ